LQLIHYCWFGGKLPPDVGARLKRWHTLHPEWQLREWKEADVAFSDCEYAQAAASTHSWAYLSDYVRLQALFEHGGVYLDTDVELLKPLDPLIDGALHIGYMHNCALGTAVIVSPPRHPIIGHLLAFYRRVGSKRMINNNAVFTEYFLQEVSSFKLDGRPWSGPGIFVHPKTSFEQPDLRHRGYAVHLFNQSWKAVQSKAATTYSNNLGGRFMVKRMLRSLLEESRCFYLRYYLRDRYRLPVRVPKLNLSFDTLPKSED